MLENGRGNIVNISSGLGRTPMIHDDSAWALYTVSKHDLEAFTEVLDLEYVDAGIKANCLSPGARVDRGFWQHRPETERTELAHPDVIRAAVLLAAQGPDGVSGESMTAAACDDHLE
jgi:3-oxoacyl-[acyl-carrier protein] reductase